MIRQKVDVIQVIIIIQRQSKPIALWTCTLPLGRYHSKIEILV